LRQLPLHLRKSNLAQLLRGRPEGIFAAPFEQGEIGPDLLVDLSQPSAVGFAVDTVQIHDWIV